MKQHEKQHTDSARRHHERHRRTAEGNQKADAQHLSDFHIKMRKHREHIQHNKCENQADAQEHIDKHRLIHLSRNPHIRKQKQAGCHNNKPEDLRRPPLLLNARKRLKRPGHPCSPSPILSPLKTSRSSGHQPKYNQTCKENKIKAHSNRLISSPTYKNDSAHSSHCVASTSPSRYRKRFQFKVICISPSERKFLPPVKNSTS